MASIKRQEGKLYIIDICKFTLRIKPKVFHEFMMQASLICTVLLTLLNRGGTHGNPAWYGLLLLPLRNPLNNNLKGHHSKYINPLDLLHMKETKS